MWFIKEMPNLNFSKFLKVHTFGSIVSLKLSLRKETVFNSMKTLKDTAKLL